MIRNPIPDELIAGNIKQGVGIYGVDGTYIANPLVGNVALYAGQAGASPGQATTPPADQTFTIVYFDGGSKFYSTSTTVVSRNDGAQINNIVIMYGTITGSGVEVDGKGFFQNTFNDNVAISTSSEIYLDGSTFYVYTSTTKTYKTYWRDGTQIQRSSTIPPGSVVSSSNSVTTNGIVYGDGIRRQSFTVDDDDNDTYYTDMHMMQVTLN